MTEEILDTEKIKNFEDLETVITPRINSNGFNFFTVNYTGLIILVLIVLVLNLLYSKPLDSLKT